MKMRGHPRSERSRGASWAARAGWLLVGAILLAGCQSQSLTQAERSNIRAAVWGYKKSINKRSFAELSPYLAKDVQVGNLLPGMTQEGFKAGMHWTPKPINEVYILSVRKEADGSEARVAFFSGDMVMRLKIGFDAEGKIRRVDDDPQWKKPEPKLPDVFTSDITVVGHLMFVRGSVNGKEGYLLLDTGASSLLLNRKYFTPTEESGTQGISGSIHGVRKRLGSAEVSELRWGGFLAQKVRGEVHDLSMVEKPENTPLLGAISYEEVKNSSLVIDWPKRKIQVFATRLDGSRKANPAGPPPQAKVPFSYHSYLPMVKARIGDQAYSLLFDSGAEACVLPNKAGLGALFRPAGLIQLSDGSARKATGLAGEVAEMQIGGVTFTHVPVAIYAIPNLGNKGFLGTPILRNGRVEINFRAREMAFWP